MIFFFFLHKSGSLFILIKEIYLFKIDDRLSSLKITGDLTLLIQEVKVNIDLESYLKFYSLIYLFK